MADGTTRRLGRLTGQSHDLAPLLGIKGGGGAWAPRPLQTSRSRLAWACQPVSAPKTHRSPAGPQTASHLGSVMTIGQQEDNLGTETIVLRCCMGTNQPMQFLAFSLREGHSRWLGTRHIRL